MTDKLLNEDISAQVVQVFSQLKEPVQLLFFGKKQDCEYCDDTLQLVSEVVALSNQLSLSVHDLDDEPVIAQQYKVDKAPSLVIAGKSGEQVIDYGIRFAGIPSGHEFSSLIHTLLMVSSRDSGLRPETRQQLKGLSKPIHLQVFVTPTCPYCPQAVVLAHQMALENPLVEAEMVEAMEFPELSEQFGVNGVPQTTINSGAGTVVGRVPEDRLLAEIMRV